MRSERPRPPFVKRQVLNGFLLLLILSMHGCENANGRPKKEPDRGANASGKAIQKALGRLLDDPVLERGRFAFLVTDPDREEPLVAHRAQERMVPASTQKLITTIASLHLLGEKHRFKTFIAYRGKIENGTLKGDLIIRGGGDPAFLSEEFPKHYGSPDKVFQKIAKACRAKGIEEVRGGLLVDGSYFPRNSLSRGRIWEDMGNYFGAFPSGMNIMDNSFELVFRTPEKPDQAASIHTRVPDIPWLDIQNRVRSSRVKKDRAYIYGKPYDTSRIVEGTLPKGRSAYSIEGSIPDPARVTAWMAHRALKKNGISISSGFSTFRLEGEEKAPSEEAFDSISSPPMQKIVHKTNRKSKNLFAECLLLETGRGDDGARKPRQAASALMKELDAWGIDTAGIMMDDGSGLAPTNRLSVTALVQMLEKAWEGEHRSAIKSSLPVAGERGTMRYMGNGTSAEGNVWAKSGSMRGVRAYAGYAKAPDGGMRTFAMIANDYACEGSKMREKLEPLLASLVR